MPAALGLFRTLRSSLNLFSKLSPCITSYTSSHGCHLRMAGSRSSSRTTSGSANPPIFSPSRRCCAAPAAAAPVSAPAPALRAPVGARSLSRCAEERCGRPVGGPCMSLFVCALCHSAPRASCAPASRLRVSSARQVVKPSRSELGCGNSVRRAPLLAARAPPAPRTRALVLRSSQRPAAARAALARRLLGAFVRSARTLRFLCFVSDSSIFRFCARARNHMSWDAVW